MRELYYFRGVSNKDLGKKLVNELLSKYSNATNSTLFDGVDTTSLYFINHGNTLDFVSLDTISANIMITYGTEIKPEDVTKIYCLKDIDKTPGYYIENSDIKKRDDGNTYNFALKSQALSTLAAMLISQIREQGKDVYGEIVPLAKSAYTLKISYNGTIVVVDCYHSGGLLRFETYKQAEQFLSYKDNKFLVESYLKTF